MSYFTFFVKHLLSEMEPVSWQLEEQEELRIKGGWRVGTTGQESRLWNVHIWSPSLFSFFFFFLWSVSTCLWTIWNSEQKLPFLEFEIFSCSYTHKLRQPRPQDVTRNISVSLNLKRQWHKYTLTKCSAGSQPTTWPSLLLLSFIASHCFLLRF